MNQDSDEFLFEHYKAAHLSEIQRTNEFRDRLSFVISHLVLVGGVLAYVVTEFPHAWHCGRALLFYVPYGFSALLWAASTSIVLWLTGGNFLYQAIPNVTEIQSFADELNIWVKNGGDPNRVLPTIKESLGNAYRQAAQHNFEVNRMKTDKLLLASRFNVLAFIVAIFVIPSYAYEKSIADKEVLKVELSERK